MRFPGFTDEWKEYSIDEIANIYGRIGFRGYTSADLVEKGNGAISLSPSNITNNQLYTDKDNTYISFYKYEESPEIKIFVGDVIFVKTGSTVGKVAYVDYLECEATLNPQLVVFKDIKCDNYLFSQILATTKIQQRVSKITVGGAVPTLSQTELGKVRLFLPGNQEQSKIATLLSLIEKRIYAQNKIINNLQSLIKGLAKTHYNSCPTLVFVKIKELGEPYTVMNLSKEQLSDSGVPCILYGELFTQYGPVIEDVINKTNVTNNLTLSRGRNLLFPSSTTVDALSLIAPSALTKPNIILGGDMFGIEVSDEYSPEYLSYYFNFIGKHDLAKYAIGSTIVHLHYKDIAEHTISIPSIGEQKSFVKLASFVKRKIDIEQKLLHNLIILKFHLLKDMFI